MMGLVRCTGVALAVLTLGLATPSGAQESLDAGKTGAQIFASDCTLCHKSPQGLNKSGRMFGMSSFLIEHYTASKQSADAVAKYLASISDARAPAAKRGGPGKRAAKGDGKTKLDEKKSGEKKPEAKSGEEKSPNSSESKTESKSKSSEKKSTDEKPAVSKSESKPDEKKPDEKKPAETKASEPQPQSKPQSTPQATPDETKKSD
jgi:cell division septation protein DedD